MKDGPHSGLHGGQLGIEVTPDVLSIADDVIELSCNHPHLLLHLLRTAYVKVFGCRPHTDRATGTGAGVRKPARDETASRTVGAVPHAQLWGFKEQAGHIVRAARKRKSDWRS